MKDKKKTNRAEEIKNAMKYSKKDLAIMYLNTDDAFNQLVEAINKKIKENGKQR